MVQFTPLLNLPYVTGADTVTSYPTTSADLATKLDTAMPRRWAGGASGVTGADGRATVTFPVGRFTAAPSVIATVVGTTFGVVCVVAPITTTGFTGEVIYTTNLTNWAKTNGFQFHWYAFQP